MSRQDLPAEPLLDVIVTYLSMTAPPSGVIPAPLGNLAILRADNPPLHFYHYLYNTVGEKWFWVDRRVMDDATLSAHIHADGVSIYVLYVDGVPAGYAEIDRRPHPTVDLAYFGLIPDFTGHGLGPYFLHQMLKLAWTDGTQEVTVNSCTLDHPKALLTYQRAGFVPTRQIHKQIPDPRKLGLIPAHHEPLLPSAAILAGLKAISQEPSDSP